MQEIQTTGGSNRLVPPISPSWQQTKIMKAISKADMKRSCLVGWENRHSILPGLSVFSAPSFVPSPFILKKKKCVFRISQLDSVWTIPTLWTSSASSSGVSRTRAFFLSIRPFQVLTLATSVSQSLPTACLIQCLLATASTVSANVLSSVFSMADTVVRWNLLLA